MTSPATSEVVESGSSKPQPPLDQASVGSWGHWEGRGHKPLERCVCVRVCVCVCVCVHESRGHFRGHSS